ncbi:hypothetical protein CRG98_031319 [Punica granatum]|uniref:G-patch domain-containing protein n=1 Tax=Punica granatum TaxID=22663 RepID=A0A2I0IWA2_PUNGR|nr:hypothetical protein CRG98_031319 [Punica granatum]
MGVTRSGRVYENPVAANKGKALAVTLGIAPEATPIPQKKVTEEDAEAFMKIIKASEYKVVEQMGKSPAHISLLALLLGSEPHREALLKTVGSIFSNNISFLDDDLPSEGYAHSRALHIVCKCNNFVVGRVMINNGSALNVCPVSTLKQMNVDLNHIRPCKTAIRAFDGSRREVNGEIDLLIEKLKLIVEERLITVKGEENYAIYKETAVPYISIGDDQNLPFHSFDTISVIRDYGKIGPSRADRMVGKILLHHNYIPGSEHMGKGSTAPLRSKRPQHIVGGTLDGPSSDSDDALVDLPGICAVTEETPSGVYISLAQENEELNNWTSVPRYSAVITDVLHSNPNLRQVDSNPSEELLEEPQLIYFGEGLDEDCQVPEIEESLHRLENRQLTSVEPTEEVNMGTKE